jgi:hypothetical protein
LLLFETRGDASASQFSFHKGILFPSPILHLHPDLMMNLELQMLLQTKLGLCPMLDSKKPQLGKYFA